MWLLLFAVILLTGLFAALWPYNRIRTAQAEAAFPPSGSFITVEGTRLHYIRKGAGKPVVLLHGGVLRANDFERVMERAAARGYDAIAFDRPGYGCSERPPRDQAAPADQARLIHGALKQLGVEKPIIVGALLKEIPRIAHMIPQLHPELALEAIDTVRELSGAAAVKSISSETL
jgi:hypothetical protein